MNIVKIACLLLAMVGCAATERLDNSSTNRTGGVVEFSGLVTADGQVVIEPVRSDQVVQALTSIPVSANTSIGPNTVMVRSVNLTQNCAGYEDGSVCADVIITSYFSGPLRNVYFWIDSITPVECAARNSDPSFAGLSNSYGLWSYGTIAANGTGTRHWVFDTRTYTTFRFHGYVYADPPCQTNPNNANCGSSAPCVNLNSNRNNCGYCGNVCEHGCSSGVCM